MSNFANYKKSNFENNATGDRLGFDLELLRR